jgi:predicted O-methyltransferase YrrM
MRSDSAARIDQIANGFCASQVLFASVRLGLFGQLENCVKSARQMARTLDADPRATRILCDALVALGLLARTAGGYANTKLASKLLVPQAPHSQHALLLHNAALYERWSRLPQIVKTGRPAPREGSARRFAQAMASSAALAARETAAAVDLSAAGTMLDIGGGPGIYAIEFARRWRHLRVVMFDGADTVRVARENITRAGLSGRVSVKAGDAFRDDLGSGYDFILLSNIVHVYSSEDNERLIGRAARALAPGGRLGVKDFILNASRTGPARASLFAVNMLVNTDGGDCYTAAEIQQWFRRAHLRRAGTVELRPPSQLVLGRRGKEPIAGPDGR